MNLPLQKTDWKRFFAIKPRHPGQLKNRSGWKIPSVGAWSHAAKRLLPQLEVNIWRFIAVLLLRN